MIQEFKFPCSLDKPNYPEEKYNTLISQIKLIKNQHLTNNEKWNTKYELIKKFIDDTQVLPYWNIKNYLGYTDNIKNEKIRKVRKLKLQELLCCNFIKNDGKTCNNYNRLSYEKKDDPFKCYVHYKRCPNCINWIDSQSSNKKYDNYCARCFKQLFPNDERTKNMRMHEKEIIVRNYINEHFKGFIHDTPLYTGNCECIHRRRIDHRKLINDTLLCIETDEFAHISYNKRDENIRYDDLYMIFSGKWIFIRFNPDKKGINIHDKLELLRIEIIKHMKRIEHNKNDELLEIYTMFY